MVVTADDSNGGTTDITVNISVSDENDTPVFKEGFFVGHSVAENLAVGAAIGDPVVAMDEDGDTLEYSITSTYTDIFGVNSSSAQLSTKVILNHDEQSSYTVNLAVTDNRGGTNGIFVTVTVTDENDAPVFKEVKKLSVQSLSLQHPVLMLDMLCLPPMKMKIRLLTV